MFLNEFDNPYPSFHYSKELIDLIVEHSLKVSYPPNKTLLDPNHVHEELYFIKKGRVRITLNSADGKEKIIAILGENALINAPIMISADYVNHYIITETPCVLYKIEKHMFWELHHTSELFRNFILYNITDNYFRLMHQIAFYSFNSCKERLYELLLISLDMQSATEDHWYKLDRQYSHNVIAKIIGANRFTVTRLINELSEEGKLRIIKNVIELKIAGSGAN